LTDALKSAKEAARRLAIRAALDAIALTGADRRHPGGRGVIFTLHHVRPDRGDGFSPNAHLSVTPEFLDTAIATVLALGLKPLDLADLPARLADPDDATRYVCFTLDDGLRDNLVHAAPVFRKWTMPYTIFVTPGFVDRTRSMWWETAEELLRQRDIVTIDFGMGATPLRCASPAEKALAFAQISRFVKSADEDLAVKALDQCAVHSGVDPFALVDREIASETELKQLAATDPLARLGAHTLTHPNLARVDEARLRRELARSAEIVAGYSGRPVTTLAYPYGGPDEVSSRELRVAAELGFSLAVTTRPGILQPQMVSALHGLPRVSLNGHFQSARYVRALASGLPFRLLRAG
jgi:peptidoglycan/xylan/chitin deacetylase (PgdA/CDA1 family)